MQTVARKNTISIPDPQGSTGDCSHSTANFISIERVLNTIETLTRQQVTGRLCVRDTRKRQWSLYFGMGRFLWADGEHQHRCWRRQLAKVCSRQALPVPQDYLRCEDRYECWDYHLLMLLLEQQVIGVEQAKAISQGVVEEVLFDLYQQGKTYSLDPGCAAQPLIDKQEFSLQWQGNRRPSEQIALLPSQLEPSEVAIANLKEHWNQWQQAGLEHYSPNLAPSIQRPEELASVVSATLYKTLTTLIDGDRTLRDLALQLGADPERILRSLLPHYRKGIILLKSVADYAPPKPRQTASPKGKTMPSIVYIDDSATSRDRMESLLQPAGYRYLGIADPVAALGILLEAKPDLIFLDLIMPVTNGYDVCAQIRRMSAISETPVAIVTGNDGIIDRMRAKMVGANDFIAKPIELDKVLSVLHKLLPHAAHPTM